MIIHVMGASGAGTTSLGAFLASQLKFDVIESDYYKWQQTTPEFMHMRPIEESNKLLLEKINNSKDLIITGSLHSNEVVFPHIDLIVYLYCPTFVRMKRIKKRDKELGRNSLKQKGEIRDNFKGFLHLARNYNRLGLDKRSKASQEWVISRCNVPVIRINTNRKINKVRDQLTSKVEEYVKIK